MEETVIRALGYLLLLKTSNSNDTLHQITHNQRIIIAVRKAGNNLILSSSRNSSLYSCNNNQINSSKVMSFRDIPKKMKENIIKLIPSAGSNEMMRNEQR
jgi:hypothetical protein